PLAPDHYSCLGAQQFAVSAAHHRFVVGRGGVVQWAPSIRGRLALHFRAEYERLLTSRRTSSSSLPLYSGGEGQGARGLEEPTPHPRPLSPEYRGEGRKKPVRRPGKGRDCAVYLSLDADVIRSADVPGVSAPNPLGLDGVEVVECVRLAGTLPHIVSF